MILSFYMLHDVMTMIVICNQILSAVTSLSCYFFKKIINLLHGAQGQTMVATL